MDTYANDNVYYVYALLDLRKPGRFTYGKSGKLAFTYEPFYIGKGKRGRAYGHVWARDKNHLKHSIIRKIKSVTGKPPKVLILRRNLAESEALRLEGIAIKLIGRRKFGTGPLSNLSSGGDVGNPGCRLSTAAFRRKLLDCRPSVQLLGRYTGTANKVGLRCRECGAEWQQLPGSALIGTACPTCFAFRLRTPEEHAFEVCRLFPHVHPVGSYSGSQNPIQYKCVRCKNTWTTLPSQILRGVGCKFCDASKSSFKSEQKFYDLVTSLYGTACRVTEYRGMLLPATLTYKCGHTRTVLARNLIRKYIPCALCRAQPGHGHLRGRS